MDEATAPLRLGFFTSFKTSANSIHTLLQARFSYILLKVNIGAHCVVVIPLLSGHSPSFTLVRLSQTIRLTLLTFSSAHSRHIWGVHSPSRSGVGLCHSWRRH